MSLIWGIPYLLIRIAVRDGVSPASVAWGRVFLAAVVLLLLGWKAGVLGGLRRRWPWLLAYAVAEVAIPFPMLAAGEQHVSSSLAAIVIASVPLVGAVLALRFDIRNDRRRYGPSAWSLASAAWSRWSDSTWPAAARR